jgi:hypothetical protein
MGQNTSKQNKEAEICKQIEAADKAADDAIRMAKLYDYQNQNANKAANTARTNLKTLKDICEKPDPRILQTWKKAENANKWPNPNPTGGAPQYVVLGDGRKRRVILTNRKKYVKVKGEHVPLKIAQKMFK